MKVLTYISTILFCFALASCEEEYAIDSFEEEKYVVVNSTFSPFKTFEVNLSYTKSKLDPQAEDEWIEDADIKVFRGDGEYLFSPKYVGNGNYSYPITPVEDQVYSIEIDVNRYPTITASSRIPKQAIVGNLKSTVVEESDLGAIKVDFEITDSEDIDNYYIWEVLQGEEYSDTSTTVSIWNTQGIQNLGPSEQLQNNGTWSKLFVQEMNLSSGISFLSFHDQQIDNDGGVNSDGEVESFTYLKLISASSDYYKYLFSLEEKQNLDVQNGKCNPEDLHRNIVGGYGIFAGYNEQYIKL